MQIFSNFNIYYSNMLLSPTPESFIRCHGYFVSCLHLHLLGFLITCQCFHDNRLPIGTSVSSNKMWCILKTICKMKWKTNNGIITFLFLINQHNQSEITVSLPPTHPPKKFNAVITGHFFFLWYHETKAKWQISSHEIMAGTFSLH